jgi:predicted ester cyclase
VRIEGVWMVGCIAVLLTSWAGPAMAGREQERNKMVARKVFTDVLERGDLEVGRAIHTPDFIAHAGSRTTGLEADLASARGWHDAFPGGSMTIGKLVAEGDLVAVFWNGRGTNTGAGNGLPATGRKVDVTGMTVFRFVRGRIAEEWNVTDQLTLLRQLGLLPAPPAPAGAAPGR